MSNLVACMEKIEEAIQYASMEGHVTNYNWRETLPSRTVVAFGLGKFMEDTHERLFSMLNVQYLSDNDKSLWGGVQVWQEDIGSFRPEEDKKCICHYYYGESLTYYGTDET